MQLAQILEENGFTSKEAKIYLATLELGNAPASSIARHCRENRVTVYTILKDLCKQGIAKEHDKDGVKHYTVIDPKMLVEFQKQKLKKLEKTLPQLAAITSVYQDKTKVYLYEGFEQVKQAFMEIARDDDWDSKESYLTFIGSDDVDPKFEEFVENEFVEFRMKNSRSTKAIISSKNSLYNDYHKEKHKTVVVDDPLFEMGNEIVIYGRGKVAILLYSSKEISALIIQSHTLHRGLKNIFNLLWKIYSKK